MNVKMEKIENNVIKLEVTVEAQKFNEAMLKAYKKSVKKFNIAGFRKGKAPMNIIKKYYGEGVFFEDTIDICCDATYPEALKENNINPVDYPKVEIVQIGEGKDFIYNAVVTVYPEVELGQYKGLEVKKVEYTVNEEQVENELKAMQTKNARIETKEQGTVEKGNIAIIDFKGYVDDVAFEGGEGEDFELEIGSGTFIDTFEDQLVGVAIGEKKTVNVTFPAEYGREDLNSKSAVFQVAVKSIKIKELPKIDDEFAKEASEFDTLEELKSDVLKKLEEASNSRAKREFEAAVTDSATENATVEVPEIMITKEVEGMLKDLEMRLQYQGLDLETYYQYTNNTEAKVKEFMKETAEKRVKTDLVIEKISKLENIEVKEEELIEKANEMSKMYGSKDQEKYSKLILNSQRESLKTALINEKVVKVLVDNCVAIA